MKRTLHIVASCADRKVRPIPDALKLRAHSGRDLHALFASWHRALTEEPTDTCAARELYGGPYWSAVKTIGGNLSPASVRLWVASAGYGLVSDQAPLKPYSVTFAPGQPDSVLRTRTDTAEARRAWWKHLASRRAPGRREPHTLRALVESDPTARVLVLGSPAYIQAMESDLLRAARSMTSGELLLVSGSPGPRPRELREAWLPSTARLLDHVGGALPAIHARVAAAAIASMTSRSTFASVRRNWIALEQESSRIMPPSRTSASDDEIKQFIRAALVKDPASKHSPLLRELRGAGRACEQSRFRELFLAVSKQRPS